MKSKQTKIDNKAAKKRDKFILSLQEKREINKLPNIYYTHLFFTVFLIAFIRKMHSVE